MAASWPPPPPTAAPRMRSMWPIPPQASTAVLNLDDYVGNIFLKFTPTQDWRADVGFRDESSRSSDQWRLHRRLPLRPAPRPRAATNITTAYDVTYSHENDHVADARKFRSSTPGFNRLCLYGDFRRPYPTGATSTGSIPYAATTTTGAGVVTPGTAPIGSVFFQDANQDYEDTQNRSQLERIQRTDDPGRGLSQGSPESVHRRR